MVRQDLILPFSHWKVGIEQRGWQSFNEYWFDSPTMPRTGVVCWSHFSQKELLISHISSHETTSTKTYKQEMTNYSNNMHRSSSWYHLSEGRVCFAVPLSSLSRLRDYLSGAQGTSASIPGTKSKKSQTFQVISMSILKYNIKKKKQTKTIDLSWTLSGKE